jgi:transposase
VVIDDLQFGLSPRMEECDLNHIAALAEVLGDVPPIVVHASTMRVIDGMHRVLAAQTTGQMTIRAVMFDGDETAAHIEAVRSNVLHGKPLSLVEREAAATRFLELVPGWSDRRIAKVSGLSPKTVGRLRTRASAEFPHMSVRVGRDGRARPIDSSELRMQVADALRTDPDASIRAIAKRTGASQATVRDVKERLARGESGLTSVPGRGRQGRRPGPAVPADQRPAVGPTAIPDDPEPRRFPDWFTLHAVTDVDWQAFVDTIPLSHVYEVADECRRRSASWRDFAMALEDRARRNRRTSEPAPGPRSATG